VALKRTRNCDGACCVQSPQFPNETGGCEYRDDDGCRLMKYPQLLKDMSTFDLGKFVKACKEWPHNMPNRATGDCCWQWAES